LSLFGGFLTPVLVSEGKDAQVVLFTYLLILGVGLLAIEMRATGARSHPFSFLLSQLYFWAGIRSFIASQARAHHHLCHALLSSLRRSSGTSGRPLIPNCTSSIRGGPGEFFCVPRRAVRHALAQDRWPLTLLVLALSGGQFWSHVSCPRPKRRIAAGAIALRRPGADFATLAIPIRLEGKWITLAFAIEGAILVWTASVRRPDFCAREAISFSRLPPSGFSFSPCPRRNSCSMSDRRLRHPDLLLRRRSLRRA